MSGFELIPGTALPIDAGPGGEQHEGRDFVRMNQERRPVSLLERLASRDDVSPTELVMLEAAIRNFDSRPKQVRTVYPATAANTDGTTGNCVAQLFEVPQGLEGHIANLLVDTPSSATINPTAPVSPSGAWAYIAKGPPSGAANNANALTFRQGMLAFAPISAGGPILPGNWTFNDSNAPIAYGGEAFYFALVGNSQSALQAITLRFRTRVNLYNKA